jgi:hypothetical protein
LEALFFLVNFRVKPVKMNSKDVQSIAQKLARIGCFSIATVYILIGIMAILSFMGESEDAADEERIIKEILDIPFGEAIIIGIVAGMASYIIWRVFEAIKDPYRFGSSFKGIARRTGIGLSAVGYLIIAIAAVDILVGGGDNGGEEEQQLLIAQIFTLPLGIILVGIVGAITAFAGFVQFKYVLGGDYNKRIAIEHFPGWLKKATHILAFAGYFARGIILSVIGYFLIKAAIKVDPEEVGDTDSAFDFLGDFGMLGDVFFIIVAAGTISYGLFMVINGIFYKFERG